MTQSLATKYRPNKFEDVSNTKLIKDGNLVCMDIFIKQQI